MAQYMAGHVAPPKVRVFPNRDAPLRLATAALVEIDEGWATLDRIYINWHKSELPDRPNSERWDLRLLNHLNPQKRHVRRPEQHTTVSQRSLGTLIG